MIDSGYPSHGSANSQVTDAVNYIVKVFRIVQNIKITFDTIV